MSRRLLESLERLSHDVAKVESWANTLAGLSRPIADDDGGRLLEAIERVWDGLTEVELWASALSGYSRPVPDYDLERMRVWLPREQATTLRRGRRS